MVEGERKVWQCESLWDSGFEQGPLKADALGCSLITGMPAAGVPSITLRASPSTITKSKSRPAQDLHSGIFGLRGAESDHHFGASCSKIA